MTDKLQITTKNVKQLQVNSDEDVFLLAQYLKINAEKIKIIEKHYEAEREATNKAHKIVTEKIKKYTEPLKKIREIANEKIRKFKLEQLKRVEEEAEFEEIKNDSFEIMPIIRPEIQKKYIDEKCKNIMSIKQDFEIEIDKPFIFLEAIIDREFPENCIKYDLKEIKKHIKSWEFDKRDCEKFGIKKIDDIKITVR